MGGPYPTVFPETFKDSGMDAYCIGEGDYAFREFLLNVEAGKPFDDVRNLITRKGGNPLRPLIDNLDELPIADRDLTLSNSFLANTTKKTFYATRGCPFNCAYCHNSFLHGLYEGQPRVRRFSVERIIEEMERVKSKYRMDFVKMGDDCFVIKADEWLEEFADKYSKRIDIPFNCFIRLDTVTDDMLKLLKRSGCFSVSPSVDSTSYYVREKILNRKMVGMRDALRKINDYGINTWVGYMLAAPESTLQDDLDTIKLSRLSKATYTSYATTTPMPKTTLYDYCVNNNLIEWDKYKGDMTECSQPSVLNCFSEKEKRVRYNIFLLGAVIAKLPFPLDGLAIFLIKIIPPNPVFKWIHDRMLNYYLENKIFKIGKENV